MHFFFYQSNCFLGLFFNNIWTSFYVLFFFDNFEKCIVYDEPAWRYYLVFGFSCIFSLKQIVTRDSFYDIWTSFL